jgi:molybdate transport system substrate-binding protein
MQGKIVPLHRQAAEAVIDGEVEIGMTQISEILPYPGVELVGPLPAAIQTYTTFAAGIGTGAKNAEGAAALIKFLTTSAAAAVIRSKGMEPG